MQKTHVIRLKPGQDLKKELQSFAETNSMDAAWIISCAGSLTHYHIRFANQQNGTMAEGHYEIVSLTGTLSRNGSHIHISVSDSTGHTSGGHLLEGNIVYTTAEIVIGESNELVFNREKDGSTPYEELVISKKQ
ncbi:MAG: PPC domain-containing DNA-binding protein [Flavisolibacter sp.]